ncbi:MAG TPA: SPW repeat protein [Longimicrobiaceae bacterium]|nr:SPW repeat protein [Longimicrobiaceae bacterium]
MRLPTRVHGVLDYLVGALLAASPWLLGFARGGAETWVPVMVGAATVAYSLFTDYELGAVRRLQMTVHLWLDAIGGIVLAASPWVLGFDERVWLPHLAFGLFVAAAALVTDTIPSYERRRGRGRQP